MKKLQIILNLLFSTDPPISIDIMQEINIDDIQIVSFLTKLSCNVSAANQQCNISWDHSNLYLSEDQAITGNETDGFYTKADIILNVSRSSGAHNVTCNAHCGEFNEVSRSLQLKIPTCYRMKGMIKIFLSNITKQVKTQIFRT